MESLKLPARRTVVSMSLPVKEVSQLQTQVVVEGGVAGPSIDTITSTSTQQVMTLEFGGGGELGCFQFADGPRGRQPGLEGGFEARRSSRK